MSMKGRPDPTLCATPCHQVRRARAWFPCVDTPSSTHPFSLRLTVRRDEVAIAPGQLIKQAWDAQRAWLTFHYSVTFNTPPHHIGVAVGQCTQLVFV